MSAFRAVILALAGLAWAGRAGADDTLDLEALLETSVVSTASSQAESSSDAPATSTTITAEDLRRHGIRTLDEALNFLSLGVVSTNPLHSAEVGARGVLITSDYGNHMLLLVNGHMLNEQWAGTAYYERGMGVPLELIDHIEVMLGPGSVLYGSSAMLGVINVFTKKASEYEGVHLVGEAELLTSGRLGLGFGRAGVLAGMPVEITGQLEYFKQQGPTFAFGPQRYGADSVTGQPKQFTWQGPATGVWGGAADKGYSVEVPAGYLRVIAGPFELNARAVSYRRATPYINNFNQYYGGFNDPYNHETDRLFSLDLRYRKTLSTLVDLSVRLYADSATYQQDLRTAAPEDCLSASLGGCVTRLSGGSRWAGVEPQLRFDWRRDGRYTTLIGVDTRLRNYRSSTTSSDPASGQSLSPDLGYDRSEFVTGAYLQQTARPWSALSLNAGARLDTDPRFGAALSPRGMVATFPWAGATLKVIYSEAFRAPSGYETLFTDKEAPNNNTMARPL
jgi:outer membrane receptor protein involved in Fe transport